MEVDEKRLMTHKRRVKIGYTMALFCALFWGIWYVPGTFIWNFDVVNYFQGAIDGLSNIQVDTLLGSGEFVASNKAFLAAAVLITGLNAAFVMLAYLVWNLFLGKEKFSEMKRSIKEMKACTKYYFLGAICGGPCAILGSFIAMGYVGGAFAAVAALAYPVIGTLLSATWLGQKISRRAIAGILIIVIGSITIYAISLFEELQAGGSLIGYIGGLMALFGWGIEGAVAAKGIDVSEPDVAITMRFGLETLIWWVIAIPALALMSIPVYEYAWRMISDPVILLSLVMLGLTFGFCYVTWYKSFPLIGVGRGQGIGSLYGICAVIFLILFIGVDAAIGSDITHQASLLVGAALCTAGTLIMFTEKTDCVECLRDTGESKEEES
ncbi:MAG: DMT family transporter [Candidatus Methanoplasma sp.]|jgi:drug/metabolite transporter (DMT)-like permease|nr:DMT family transporter [Candidatus Methanoplasma sp.]